MNNKLKYVIVSFALFIPIFIYLVFWSPDTQWEFDSFFEAYIIYFGTMSLGFVSLFQNNQIIKENKYLRSLEENKFNPLVQCHPSTLKVMASTDYDDDIALNFIDNKKKNGSIFINLNIDNLTSYPIIKIEGNIERNGKIIGNSSGYSTKNYFVGANSNNELLLAIYLLEGTPMISEPNDSPIKHDTFSYPLETFEYLIKEKVIIHLKFINIYNRNIKGKIWFDCLNMVDYIYPVFEYDEASFNSFIK